MTSLVPNLWTTDPEYIDLLNYLIERTENVESPMSIQRMTREFKKKSGALQTQKCLAQRIERARTGIHSFEHIDTKTKVKMLFALSASVNPEFLKELKKDAFVENDDKKRITHYKANDGSLELRGDHSRSAKNRAVQIESKQSLRSVINSYYKNKNDAEAVPETEEEKEMWNLIAFITEKCANVITPLNFHQLIKDFNNHVGITRSPTCIKKRIRGYCQEIQRMEFVDARSKVEQLFSLSATVNSYYLAKLRKDALIEVDEKNRITYYKAKNGSLELRGDHSQSAKMKTTMRESKSCRRKLVRDYFKIKNDGDAIPKNEEEKEMWSLIDFITEKCDNATSPLNIRQLAKDFNKHFGISRSLDCIRGRIRSYCLELQNADYLDTPTRVKQLFSLGETLHADYLEKLRKAAHVEVDKNNRISHYKATNGGLELRGYHNKSARTYRSFIIGYFENKNGADEDPNNEEEKEMANFIEFITEKCENVTYPLNICQLTRDFKKHFGLSRSLACIQNRIKAYCHEIQKLEYLDTHSKVKQLFGLSAMLDSDYLKELKKDADVEVDNLNRITKYTANNGRLTLLHGYHSASAKRTLSWIEGRKNEKTVKKQRTSDSDKDEESEKEDGYSEEDSDEYSSEEFGSEFDSDEENDHLDKSQDFTEPSNEAVDRNRSEISIDDNFDFDPPTERSHRSEVIGMGEDEENDPGITLNASVKTRYGRLSKRRHRDSVFSNNQVESSSSGASKPAKQKRIAVKEKEAACSFPIESEESLENLGDPEVGDNLSDFHGPRIQEIDDYSSIDNRLGEPELPSVDKQNTNIEAQNTENRADAVAPERKPEKENLVLQKETTSNRQTNECIPTETPIKAEHEEPMKVKNSTEDVKPEITRNFKIKFFNAMKLLILFLDDPSLSALKSETHKKIRKMKGSNEMLQNNELIPALELLVARMANHSAINISESMKSVSIIQFFSYLKASILNSKLIGVEGLVENISKLIEESQNKRIPMEKVANALRATLDIDGF